jgi:hypothetical protein
VQSAVRYFTSIEFSHFAVGYATAHLSNVMFWKGAEDRADGALA